MKHSLLTTPFCLLVALSMQAQNWSLKGNSNASATNSIIGTNNAIPLRFFTNNAARMYIHAISGNVGIGTTSPLKPLHVNGFGAFGNQITAANSPRALNLADVNAVMRVLRVHATYAPAVELISRTTANGADVAYWDFYAEPSDKSFRIRDRVGGGAGLDRLTISNPYGHVGIGTTTPTNKLHVVNTGTSAYAIYGDGGTYRGIYGQGSTGVYGLGTYDPDINEYGTGVEGVGAPGVYGRGTRDPNNRFYGLGVVADGGVYGIGTSDPENFYFGDGVYGVPGHPDLAYAGNFSGGVYATGFYEGSDRKLKENIADISSAMDIINKLQPKSYDFRQDGNFKLMNLPKGKHFGLIAQEVEEVLPALVKETQFDTRMVQRLSKQHADSQQSTKSAQQPSEKIEFKAVNYTELIPIVVKAMQEQQKLIDQQQQQIEQLKEEISNLKHGQNTNTFLSNAKLSAVSPNPVKGTASIQYAIPEGTTRAHLLITDALGRQIKAIQLSTSGTIKLDVTSLANGVYNYSLIVDNKTITTRKMTVVK